MKRLIFLLAAVSFLSFGVAAEKRTATQIVYSQWAHCRDFSPKGSFKNENLKLQALMKLHWSYNMQVNPEWAAYVGYPTTGYGWVDSSKEARAERSKHLICKIEALKKIKREQLSKNEQTNYDLLQQNYTKDFEGLPFEGELLAIDHLSLVTSEIANILGILPMDTKDDIEKNLIRLEQSVIKIQQNKALLQEGLQKGIVAAQVILASVPDQLQQVTTRDPRDSSLFSAFKKLPEHLSSQEVQEYQKRAATIIKEEIMPVVEDYKKFIVEVYQPQARKDISLMKLPKGEAWYKYLVKVHTTTSMIPEEIHQLGISEVARIEAEMLKIKDQVKFKGDLKAFNHYLLTDKKFFYEKAEDLLAGYRDIAKRIDPELSKIFGLLPRMPYGVRAIPDYMAASSSAAFYTGGSLVTGRAGYFEANTSALDQRPKWGMEALTLHEAVPGHHLQGALAVEQGDLPDFRREGGYTAYSEGWGLYAESLGSRLGMYKDPYSKYGMYTYEMWRAVRLVVDTGMHYKGWSREQALQFFMDKLPKGKVESEVEIDRYIVWPGQALSYKIGQLKILSLREKAEKELGDRFNIRQFHDEILSHGSLPLNVLEKFFDQWLSLQKQNGKSDSSSL